MREVSAEANQLLAPRWRIISHPQVNRISGASTYLSHFQKGSCLVPLGKVKGQNSWSSHFYYDAQQDADLERERWGQRASSSHHLSKPFHGLVREVVYKFPMGHLKHPDDHQGNLYLCAKRLTTVVPRIHNLIVRIIYFVLKLLFYYTRLHGANILKWNMGFAFVG